MAMTRILKVLKNLCWQCSCYCVCMFLHFHVLVLLFPVMIFQSLGGHLVWGKKTSLPRCSSGESAALLVLESHEWGSKQGEGSHWFVEKYVTHLSPDLWRAEKQCWQGQKNSFYLVVTLACEWLSFRESGLFHNSWRSWLFECHALLSPCKMTQWHMFLGAEHR